jgi:hypothetical protein
LLLLLLNADFRLSGWFWQVGPITNLPRCGLWRLTRDMFLETNSNLWFAARFKRCDTWRTHHLGRWHHSSLPSEFYTAWRSLSIFSPLHQIQLIPVMRHRQRFSMAPGRRGEITFAQKRVGTCDCQADGGWGWCLKGKRMKEVDSRQITHTIACTQLHTHIHVCIYIYVCVYRYMYISMLI